MKEITYNNDNLLSAEIDEVIIRTKALIINSNDEIMLGYSHNTYQFPGGHLEKNETLLNCLIREVREETGLEIANYKIFPFEKITYYNKNYHKTGKNRQNDIYYYIIKTDESFNLNNTNYDAGKIEGNFSIKIVSLKDFEKTLLDSINDNPINKVVVKEMLEVFNEYKKIKDNLNI